ncbi:hypothetical protein GC098_25280 [Paenibacillus sp. LMG 31458]|uniref:Uncharacterized protein n=1 Tax=Paenibacillus phytorum TaxID=2654977 RepID=A0ABX1Y1C8_9BACL|nr:hypothetical protein [Paenibacillus phytorum]NOU74662.1 hypothetical protein [Paenibacillus phytorum]
MKKIETKIIDLYEYGVKFQIDQPAQSQLFKLLNYFSLELRETPLVQNCKFIIMDGKKYFMHLYFKGLLGK